ncbi:hypothetical protein CLOBY_32870 [Clostridium saccharobutylicum]|uniref:hypothetical protein n=1 Tax=Clostridium saccharobutylicum TaxID=169679 RepID=UPI000983FB04|nr:hypothetical protein [Clostridium saccharobutylicum]AQS11133.1 hypothetical protein CLOBY_32870 [Clostridium saccharobutylicum]MBC2437528.1 hypothetical protein [Clostridium saccharobutylicum]NSB89924.1 hypothetical protein [Clostridium saccharobutylicum]NYC32134.1 hypothetical protein [Clostridium saccharobutylicum]OOM14970.1 hypothetical protein CLSAB_30820 [Clostridium saccharobutylicum]
MKYVTKTILIGCIAIATLLNGCSETKVIKISDDVKKEVFVKSEDSKIRSEPVLKKKLSGLDNQEILFWIDDENILTRSQPTPFEEEEEKVILYSYNLENGESIEILNDSNITRIYDYWNGQGLILLGNKKQAFVYNPKERKLEEGLDIDKEFKDGIPGCKTPKEKQDLLINYKVKFIDCNYISYESKIVSRDEMGMADRAEYTVLNYKDNKKYTVESRDSMAALRSKLDLTEKNIYIQELDKITKLNLETGEKSSMKLSVPHIINVFEDGTLFVECIEENEKGINKEKWYKVDFDKKEVTKYEESFGGKDLSINGVDFKNKFVVYRYLEKKNNIEKSVTMYGKLEGDKFIVKDKLFKNNEENGGDMSKEIIFSPNHNKFIAGLIATSEENSTQGQQILKDDEYLFELE